MPRDPNDLLHGTLDLLVLTALASGPMHGHAVSQWLERRARDGLEILDSALYKALYRLEDAGAITAEWGLSENNRRAKFYSLTPAGREQLAREAREWQRTADLIAAFFALKPEAT